MARIGRSPRFPRLLLLLASALLLLPALPAAATGVRCEPRSAADWAQLCLSSGGREEIERLLPGSRAHRTLGGVDTAEEACKILLHADGLDECAKARRQFLAAALNWNSHRIGPDCCLEWQGKEVRLGDLLRLHDENCNAGRDCERIRTFLAAVNKPGNLHPCGNQPPPPPPPPPGGGCCEPRSKGFWHRQCLGIGLLDPGKGGGKGPGLHPAFSEAELRRILAAADRRISRRCGSACEALDEDNYKTAKGRACAQYSALVLNYEAGFLDGCGRADLDKRIREVERLLDAGNYEEAKNLAERINLGTSVRPCRGSGGGDDDEDEDDDHQGDDDHGGHRHGPGCGHPEYEHDHDGDGRADHDADDCDRHGKDHGQGKGKGHDADKNKEKKK